VADHLDAPGLTSPMSDPRTDITDVYAFRKPGDSSKSILVLNVNPLAPALAAFFNSEAIYTINVDTDGDAVADRSFRIRFSGVEGRSSCCSAKRRRAGSDRRRAGIFWRDASNHNARSL